MTAKRRSPLRSKSGKMRVVRHETRETRVPSDPRFMAVLSECQQALARQMAGRKNIHVEGRR